MLTFKALGLSPNLLKGVEELGFDKPTPIQEKIIPIFLESENDITGLAQTGTGKTAAFGLPIIEQTDLNKKSVQALILAPTRELCMQISKDLENYAKFVPELNIVPVYGGASIDTQVRALKRGAHIIVATPGRMLDLMKRKAANVEEIRTLVLDEADEMLHMGFRDELDSILEKTPSNKRTLLFSATMPKEVARIAVKYMKDPLEVTIGKQNAGAENIQHIYYQVHAKDRYLALKRIADYHPDIYGIVFCRTRMETKEIADKLIKDGYNADALHGDLSQSQRDHVMNRFRERTLQMLVATDVAARGIDVSDITHVINYNLPEELEVYTHRTGRTGRADKSGVAISIVNYREKSRIPQIERMIQKKVERQPVPNGSDICKRQLFNLIDRMEKVEVDEDQISPFMETVNKKLEWLSKEDIIKHFVSLEFNRFLEYYKDARDLDSDDGFQSERSGRRREDRYAESGGERSRGRDRDRDRDRDGDRDRGRDRKPGKGSYTRFFMNLGKKDGVVPKNIIGMINDNAQDRDIHIGAIEILNSFSFFEVGERYAEKVQGSFRNVKFKGRNVIVEVAAERKENPRKRKKEKS